MTRAKFHQMTDGTREDWHVIARCALAHNQKLPDRILEHLHLLAADDGGFAVSRLEHCLQTATRAQRDGRSEEYVVCALLHDIGDTLGSYNHADIAAAILRPFVSEEHLFMVEKHAIFQGYYFFEHLGLDKHMRDAFREHPHYATTLQFCALYDQRAFDPDYESLPLEAFEPMLRRVLARPVRSIYLKSATSAVAR
jgi:predicted HD phosphohydrolase